MGNGKWGGARREGGFFVFFGGGGRWRWVGMIFLLFLFSTF